MTADTEVLFPLRVAQAAADRLCHLLSPMCRRIEVAGEIRRLRPAVAGIDLLAIPKIEPYEEPSPGDLFDAKVRKEHHYLWEVLDRVVPEYQVKGEAMRRFLRDDEDLSRPIRTTIYTADRDNWGYMLLLRTGPEKFNAHVLASLHRQALKGHEGRIYPVIYNLQPHSEPLPAREEEDVFRLAGLKPLPPAQRSWS